VCLLVFKCRHLKNGSHSCHCHVRHPQSQGLKHLLSFEGTVAPIVLKVLKRRYFRNGNESDSPQMCSFLTYQSFIDALLVAMKLGRAFRALVVAEPPEPCVQAPLAVDPLAAYLPAGIRAHHALAAATTALIALTFLSGIIIIMFKSRTIAALQREVHMKMTISHNRKRSFSERSKPLAES
jgi:hypothetical protein